MDDSGMMISERRLPMCKAYREYFISANGSERGFSVSLSEMEQLLRTGVLFEKDADKVVGFLGDLMHCLEAEEIKITPVKDDYHPRPKFSVEGTKFPDVLIENYLEFFDSGISTIIYQSYIRQKGFMQVATHLEETEEFTAFNNAFYELNESVSRDLRSRIKRIINSSDYKDWIAYSLDIGHMNEMLAEGGKDRIVYRIIKGAEYVQKAITMTNRVIETRNARIKSLVDTLNA